MITCFWYPAPNRARLVWTFLKLTRCVWSCIFGTGQTARSDYSRLSCKHTQQAKYAPQATAFDWRTMKNWIPDTPDFCESTKEAPSLAAQWVGAGCPMQRIIYSSILFSSFGTCPSWCGSWWVIRSSGLTISFVWQIDSPRILHEISIF